MVAAEPYRYAGFKYAHKYMIIKRLNNKDEIWQTSRNKINKKKLGKMHFFQKNIINFATQKQKAQVAEW